MSDQFITRFYKLWDLLKNTPYPILKQILEEQADKYPDTHKLYDKILLSCRVENKQIINSYDEVLYTGYTGTRWGMNPVYNFSYPKDLNFVNAALEAREKTWQMFSNVFIPGSYAFNTNDMNRYRKMIIDWSSSSKAFKDLFRKASNVFSLPPEDIDKAIRGFGIDFVNKNTLDFDIQRGLFLLGLTELYKIKGTPESIRLALNNVGVPNTIIREYWIERDPEYYKLLRIRGIASGKYKQTLDTDPLSLTYNQYVFSQNVDYYDDVVLTWQNFISRLGDIGEPHWWYTHDEIVAIEFDPDVKIKLPSAMPYFGVEYYTDIQRYNVVIGILQNIMASQITEILRGNRDLVPAEIGVSGFNEDLTEKDLWITGYDKPLSLVECFLGFSYAQIRYDEWVVYNDIKQFMIEHGITGTPDFEYPWSVQQLINWAWDNKDVWVLHGVYKIDSIMRMYQRKKSHYYCSTNELITWWLSVDPANYWTSKDDNDIPDIFFSTDYTFRYNEEPVDTTMDQILFYRGTRQLDFKSVPFEYEEALDDAKRLRETTGNRLEYDASFGSALASNYTNNHQPLQTEAQEEYLNTYFDYVSWVPENIDGVTHNYNEEETHDGNSITPIYISKYPKSKKWNWAIDSKYLYICLGVGKWIRKEIESTWGIGPTVTPTSGPLDNNIIGYQFYENGYVYKYVSVDTWVRFEVQISWDYCDSPISPDGYIKAHSDISMSTVMAKIDASIAVQYITDKSVLLSTVFDLILDPLTDNSRSITYDVRKLTSFISTYNLVLDSSGYLKTDFGYWFQNPKLYIRVIDETDSIIWVRTNFADTWESGDNGTAMFDGGYRYPDLDLTNRYDAERILRGTSVLTSEELIDLASDTNDGEILVSQGSNGYPETWIWDPDTNIWILNSDNRINDINLGVNDGLISWIDQNAETEEDYEITADKMLNAFSNYVKIIFQDPTLDIAGIYKRIGNSGLYKDIIDFFKPKRARLLYFSINLEFDDRLFNSIIVDDRIEHTKLLQTIDDITPRQDGIWITDAVDDDDEMYMYKAAYYEDDVTKALVIPYNSEYGYAYYYVSGFDDPKLNGFYFQRSDLGSNYYLNYHNVALVYITNDEEIDGYRHQWIIALRRPTLSYCNALYLNYHVNPTTGQWYTIDDIHSSSSSSSGSYDYGQVRLASVIIYDDLRPEDILNTVDLSSYDLGKTNHWNVVHERSEPDKTNESISKSLVHWNPCITKDIRNIRTVFPEGILGYQENIEGERIDGWDADLRNDKTQEYSYVFWKTEYPYSDDQLMIKDGVLPPIGFRTNESTELISLADYNAIPGYAPPWWEGTIADFKTGPVHHRPVYLGIQHTEHDCWPCIDLSGCCDYYDLGCKHDGPTNPTNVIYDTEWGPGQYSDYNLKFLEYDEWTGHHRARDEFITDSDEITLFEDEPNWESDQVNPGDTYCNECNDPLFTPDIAVFTIPEKWKYSGVFHNEIRGIGFDNSDLNNSWVPTEDFAALGYTLNSDDLYEFPAGYRLNTTHIMVHIFHRPSGYHYWEIKEKDGLTWDTLLRSEIKEQIHTLDCIVYETDNQTYVKPDHFLNGHDIDCVEDKWTDNIVDPSNYIGKTKEEITELEETSSSSSSTPYLVSGYFTSSYWIKFDFDPTYNGSNPGTRGQLSFEATDSVHKTGNLYICIGTNSWRKVTDVEYAWTLTSESLIRPESSNNFYGYYYKDWYLYLYSVIEGITQGWVRIAITEEEPDDKENYITNEWVFRDSESVAYRSVSLLGEFVPSSSSSSSGSGESIDEDHMWVCGDIVPFIETFQGIRLYYEDIRCFCNVEDEVEISVYDYIIDDNGDYFKIEGINPANPADETRREHRFLPTSYLHLFEVEDSSSSSSYEQLTYDFDDSNVDVLDHYLLKNYIPFYLYSENSSSSSSGNQTKLLWRRYGSELYNKVLIDPSEWYPEFRITEDYEPRITEDGHFTRIVESTSHFGGHLENIMAIVEVPAEDADIDVEEV